MDNRKPFFITTAIAYANGAPHIGHAFEFVLADTIARYLRSSGDVYFITGMDEHGQKIERKARETGVPVEQFVDQYADQFKELDKELGVSWDYFVRTSDKKHHAGAQALWNKLAEKGDLEKRSYQALYCVGCEEFKTEKDLDAEGRCPIHLKVPEVVEEENWFFKLSNYTETIKDKIKSDGLKVYPEARKNEILALLERGLDDVSFSRPKTKVSWGIPVPGDDSQVMYVWCDALSNYITAIGYGTDSFRNDLWENATHVIGKDILRFHAAIWPGMLLSAGLPLPKNIIVHGHITSGGQKMSKTLGNVIDPKEVVDMFRPACGELAGEAARFVLLHEVPTFEDGDITADSIKTAYTAYLANGIGNLTNRIMKMAISYGVSYTEYLGEGNLSEKQYSHSGVWSKQYDNFNLFEAIRSLFRTFNALDAYIQREEPFKKIKVNELQAKKDVAYLLHHLLQSSYELEVFLPKTALAIRECVRNNKMPDTPLFGRLA